MSRSVVGWAAMLPVMHEKKMAMNKARISNARQRLIVFIVVNVFVVILFVVANEGQE